MAKIAKNIKTFRTENNMTQDALAEKLSVTRQTISSWENGRTQPDIDMLEALSEALGTDIEALIYGKKRNVGLEDDGKQRSKKMLTVILSAIGTLLLTAGVIIIFFDFWQRVAELLKNILAFLPLAAGAGFGLFAAFSKKKSVLLRESAGIVWIAGVIATNALVNSIYSVDFGFGNLFLADVLLTLPAVFLLDAAAPFTVSTVMVSWWHIIGIDGFNSLSINTSFVFCNIISFVLLAVLGVFAFKTHKQQKHYTQTLFVLAAAVNYIIFTVSGDFGEIGIIGALAALLLINCTAGYSKVLSRISDAALALTMVICVYLQWDFTVYDYAFKLDLFSKIYTAIQIISVVALAALATAAAAKNFKKNKLRPLRCIFVLGMLFTFFILSGFDEFIYAYVLLALAYGITLLIEALGEVDLFKVNVGLLTICAAVVCVLWSIDLSVITIGIVFVASGAALLTVNGVTIKKMKKAKEQLSVADGESEVRDDA